MQLNNAAPVSILIVINAIAFMYYGYNCLFSERMSEEFNRFRLSILKRKITGALQIIGALGLLAGLFYYPLGLVASLGLSILMLLGFGVRLKIKDGFFQTIPSFLLMVLNGYFTWYFAHLIGFW